MLVDDAAVGEQTVDVAAGGESSLHFVHRFPSAGAHAVTMRTSGDRLELDNSRWLVLPVRSEIRVLCVAGREGAAKYLANALNPNPGGDSPIRPIVIAEGDLADAQLADFDCVFLCNVAQLTASEAERLAHYAAVGRRRCDFPRRSRRARKLQRALAKASTAQRSAAVTSGRHRADRRTAAVRSRPARLSASDRRAVSRPRAGRPADDARQSPLSARCFQQPTRRGNRRRAAGRRSVHRDGAVGRGRTVLVATDGSLSSVDPASGEAWTTWPTWPSFLPLVRELLAYASGGQQTQWQQLVGAPLSGSIGESASPPAGSDELQMVRPDGRAASVSLRSTPAGPEWSYTDTDVSGIYTLRGLPQGRTQQFAVNVDTAEGDLAKIDPQQLPPDD